MWTNICSHKPPPHVNPGPFICNLISHVPSDNIGVTNHFNSLKRIKPFTFVKHFTVYIFQYIITMFDTCWALWCWQHKYLSYDLYFAETKRLNDLLMKNQIKELDHRPSSILLTYLPLYKALVSLPKWWKGSPTIFSNQKPGSLKGLLWCTSIWRSHMEGQLEMPTRLSVPGSAGVFRSSVAVDGRLLPSLGPGPSPG